MKYTSALYVASGSGLGEIARNGLNGMPVEDL